MTPSDIVEIYRYNRWANAELLAAASALSNVDLERPLGTSHGSLFGTLLHILWGEWLWLGRWQQAAPQVPDPLSARTLSELKSSWSAFEGSQEAFLLAVREPDLHRIISYENPPGTTWSYSLQHMLQHVANHSAYHRGQVVSLLRQLGAQPPPTDFLVFFDVSTTSGA